MDVFLDTWVRSPGKQRILFTGGNRNGSGKSEQWPMLAIIKSSDHGEHTMGGI